MKTGSVFLFLTFFHEKAVKKQPGNGMKGGGSSAVQG